MQNWRAGQPISDFLDKALYNETPDAEMIELAIQVGREVLAEPEDDLPPLANEPGVII